MARGPVDARRRGAALPAAMTSVPTEFLNRLERQEAALLAWGYVDAGFSRRELDASADEFVLVHDETGTLTGADVVSELLERRLIVEVDAGATTLMRTRMAETVRLLARLRQLFPRHTGAAWSQAATLVADYRLAIRPRSYPRRDVEIATAIDTLSGRGVVSGRRAEVIEALLRARGSGFSLSRFQVDAAAEILRGLDAGRDAGTIIGAG